MITILATAILLIILSQIIVSCRISNVTMTDSSITNYDRIIQHILSVIYWPVYAFLDLLLIANKKYRRNIAIILFSIIICFLSIVALWNQVEEIPIKSLLPTLSVSAVLWFMFACMIDTVVAGIKDGTLFDD